MSTQQKQGAAYYLWRLIGFSIAGTLLAQITGAAVIELQFKGHGATSLLELGQKIPGAWYYVRLLQLLHSVLSFLVPSLIVWKMYSGGYEWKFPKEERSSGWVYLMIPAMLFTFFPLVQSFYVFNQEIHFFEPLHSTLVEMEAQMNRLIEGMLADKSVWATGLNFFIIAVVAAVLEELFFRGVLQRILTDYIDPHKAIFISALLFSSIHMQFFGFLPRLALGIFFGYLYWRSSRLMVPVFAHFLFNGVQLASYYYASGQKNDTDMSETIVFPPLLTLSSTVLFFTLYFIFHAYFTKNKPETDVIK